MVINHGQLTSACTQVGNRSYGLSLASTFACFGRIATSRCTIYFQFADCHQTHTRAEWFKLLLVCAKSSSGHLRQGDNLFSFGWASFWRQSPGFGQIEEHLWCDLQRETLNRWCNHDHLRALWSILEVHTLHSNPWLDFLALQSVCNSF